MLVYPICYDTACGLWRNYVWFGSNSTKYVRYRSSQLELSNTIRLFFFWDENLHYEDIESIVQSTLALPLRSQSWAIWNFQVSNTVRIIQTFQLGRDEG